MIPHMGFHRCTKLRAGRKPSTRVHWLLSAACGLTLLLSLGVAGSAAQGGTGGTITVQAGVVDITAESVTATGSPVLTSPQGTLKADQFTVSLDKQGHPTRAVASGSAHFDLAFTSGSYRTLQGNCPRVTLFPDRREAALDGGVSAVISGSGRSPINITAASANVFAATPGRPAHITMSNGRSVIPTGR